MGSFVSVKFESSHQQLFCVERGPHGTLRVVFSSPVGVPRRLLSCGEGGC